METDLSARAMEAIRRLVDDLAAGNWSSIEADGRIGRLTLDELQRAIAAYGRTLVPLPAEGVDHAFVFPLTDAPGRFSVDVTLWTLEEGLSDLTLQLTIVEHDHGVRGSIDDLHVL